MYYSLKMQSFKVGTRPFTSYNRMKEGRRGAKQRWEFGKGGKQSYSLKHDNPEGSTQCTVMDSRDGMNTLKDRSVMGIEMCSQMQPRYSGRISTGTVFTQCIHGGRMGVKNCKDVKEKGFSQ